MSTALTGTATISALRIGADAGAFRLGAAVRVGGRQGTVVARTLARVLYDVRFADGSILRYLGRGEVEPAPGA
ncbi:hypothetical protein [Arenibaculum pallidiluteum]|uniref:hypothetical protein n=1 Tax=Arenibaculum pallidiluteum TaxID=2812559 RepID=UPI001A96BDB7|nr:hypothetical protein [Arenibaculum pallidiluteum]